MIPLKGKRINRRHLLRAGATGIGTAIALPALEAMYPTDKAFAQDAAGKPRFVAIYQPNGHHMVHFHPEGSRRNLDFKGKGTAPMQKHLDRMTLLRRMEGAHSGAVGNGHLTGIVSWLTAARVKDDDQKKHKVSLDTLAAEHWDKVAPTGRNQQLVLSGSPFLDPGRMAYNNEQKDWISTARNGEKIFAEIDIDSVFTRIMSGRGNQEPVDNSVMEARLALRKSALDFVNTSVTQLNSRLGTNDKLAVENYLNSIREVERRLSVAPGAGSGGSAPAAICSNPDMKFTRKWPSERKADLTNDYIDEHWQDTMRVLQVAFQCEVVRSVAYMLETEAGESPYRNHGLPNSHNSAHSTNRSYAERDILHMQLLSEMYDLFDATPVAGGSLLDQTLILFGMGQGTNHQRDNISAIIGGFTGVGTETDKIKHGALHDFRNDVNARDMIRTCALHLGVVKGDEAYHDSGPNAQMDWSV